MKKTKLPLFETLAMIIGELITSVIICGVFLIIRKFGLSVLLGALLGSLVTVANFIFLMISSNRAIDRVMAERGEGELSDDEAAQFSAKHQASIQAAVKLSYIIRTLCIAATLVLAFLLDGVFNVIATVIPLLMFRPILIVSQLIKNKIN